MSEAEESPAQKQSRLRRERMQAKIKGGGTDRLDKITKLAGRKPELMRAESGSSSPLAQSPASRPMTASTPPLQQPLTDGADTSQIQAQQEYFRSILRAQQPDGNDSQQEQPAANEDPMMKMLQSIMGGIDPSDPNAPEMPQFNPDEISKATGIPSFLTNMFLGQVPETEEQKKQASFWKIIHTVVALLMGSYVVWTVNSSVAAFGEDPPTPPTARNPFLVFIMGELLVEGARLTLKGTGMPKGLGAWWQIAKDIGSDSSVVVFLLGMSTWWNRASV